MSECKRMMEEAHHSAGRATPRPEPWLRAYPWQDIVWTVAGYWRLPAEEIGACAAASVRERWERGSAGEQTLCDALRLCRECQAARAFGKYECESFVIVARDVVKPCLGQMSATLAAAVITIIGDYVRGAGEEMEMTRAVTLILDKYVPPAKTPQAGSPAGL